MAFRNQGGGLSFSPPTNVSPDPLNKPDFDLEAQHIGLTADTFMELIADSVIAMQANGALAEIDISAPSGHVKIGGAGGLDSVELQDDGDTFVRGGIGKDLALRGKVTGAGALKTGRVLIGMTEGGVDHAPFIQLVPKGSAVYPDPGERPYIHMGTNITICGMQQVNPGDLIAGAGQALPATPDGYIPFLDASGVGGLHVPYYRR